MIKMHPIQTGNVRIRQAQLKRKTGGPVRMLMDPDWSEWLPIYAWAIEHPEGIFVVDTGETARTATSEGSLRRCSEQAAQLEDSSASTACVAGPDPL